MDRSAKRYNFNPTICVVTSTQTFEFHYELFCRIPIITEKLQAKLIFGCAMIWRSDLLPNTEINIFQNSWYACRVSEPDGFKKTLLPSSFRFLSRTQIIHVPHQAQRAAITLKAGHFGTAVNTPLGTLFLGPHSLKVQFLSSLGWRTILIHVMA